MANPIWDGSTFGQRNYGSGTSYSFSQTAANQADRIILVIVTIASATATVTSVNITSPTARTGKLIAACGGTGYYHTTEVWFITNPDVGANTIAVVISENVGSVASSIVYYNANQSDDKTTTFTHYDTNKNTSTSITKAVNSTDTDLALAFLGIGGSATYGVPNGSETARIGYSNANLSTTSCEIAGSSGGRTPGFKSLTGYYNMLIVASLKLAAASTTPINLVGGPLIDIFNAG